MQENDEALPFALNDVALVGALTAYKNGNKCLEQFLLLLLQHQMSIKGISTPRYIANVINNQDI